MRRFLRIRGFTLVEIIVVIAIITILTSAGGLVAYQGARERARDTQRLNDLERIAVVVEAYRQEYGSYPDCGGGISIEPGGVTKGGGGCTDGGTLLSYIQTTLGEIPHDPLGPGNADYFYYYDLHNCTDNASGMTRAVKVFAANMERTPTNETTACSGGGTGNDGGFNNTTAHGGTKNPSVPFTIILGRYQ